MDDSEKEQFNLFMNCGLCDGSDAEQHNKKQLAYFNYEEY